MENVTAVFCDLRGSYYDRNKENRREKVELFVENLSSLKNTNNSDKILFSFITGDSDPHRLLRCIDELTSYLKKDIEIGTCFYEKGTVIDGNVIEDNGPSSIKAFNVIKMVKDCKEKYSFDQILFIDDSSFNLTTFAPIFEKFHLNIPYELIDARGGLDTINNCLSQINSKKHK